MKTMITLVLLAVFTTAVHAQSRGGGAGGLGNLRQSSKRPSVASVKDLDRAEKLAQQAGGRLGTSKKASRWAQGNWDASSSRSGR